MNNQEQHDRRERPVIMTPNDQVRLWYLALANLNVLLMNLPIDIKIVSDRTGFSDEWLIENGFEHLISEK